ncbi:hypothetical protein [Georgenia sp. H159]|uniref:hypothetical protein n=1 Tax=Georgenia sp. H159 TaxID=3076115 RepID=UPI002D797E38|nr:hypothetical protein [Georgenia sp. H159]
MVAQSPVGPSRERGLDGGGGRGRAASLRGAPGELVTQPVVHPDAGTDDVDPGDEPAATVTTTLRALTAVWQGDLSWATALRGGAVDVTGPVPARRQVPARIGQSQVAAVRRPA